MITQDIPRVRIIVLSEASTDGDQPQLAQRLLTLTQTAAALGMPHMAVEDLVNSHRLPVVRMPSRSDRPVRTQRRVPVAWLCHWREMEDRGRPRITGLGDVGAGLDEPLEVSVSAAASSVGLSRYTAYELIAAGRFARVERPAEGPLKVRVHDLDAWVLELVRAAEEGWYGVLAGEAAATCAG